MWIATGVACLIVMPEHGFVRRPAHERLSPVRELRKKRHVRSAPHPRPPRSPANRRDHVLRGRGLGRARSTLDALHSRRGAARLWGLDPVVWFGVFNVVGLSAGIVVHVFPRPALPRRRRRAARGGAPRTHRGLSAAMIVFGLAGAFVLAAVAYLVARLAKRILPLYAAWLNRNIEDSSIKGDGELARRTVGRDRRDSRWARDRRCRHRLRHARGSRCLGPSADAGVGAVWAVRSGTAAASPTSRRPKPRPEVLVSGGRRGNGASGACPGLSHFKEA